MQKWQRVLATHHNANLFAAQYHSAQLRFKMLLQWRIVLRKKLKMVRKAREADKYLHVRRAWKLWADKLADAKRRGTLQVWERRKVQAVFNRTAIRLSLGPRADLRSAQNGSVSPNGRGSTDRSKMSFASVSTWWVFL
jgi:hypothetical protein